MAMQQTNSICPFCGVGCGIGLLSEGDRVRRVAPLAHHPISQGQLCAKGWNTAYGINRNRITTPLIRRDGQLEPASWEQALHLISSRLNTYIAQDGPDSIGIISSARATNEDNYAAQKFARAVLKTNNIDHCARICHSPSVAGLKRTLGSGAMTNSIKDVGIADVIFVIGADPTENHSVIGGHIMRAKLRGAKLIVADPRRTRLAEMADVHLQLNIGSNIDLLNGLLHIIFANQWEDREYLETRCEGVEDLKQHVQSYPPDVVSAATGIGVAQLQQAAHIYSQGGVAFLAYGMGITQFVGGTQNVMAVSNLALVCGHVGKPGGGINPLRGQNNVQGACDMGCLPNVYPGYQGADDPQVRDKFAQAWGTPVPETPGLTTMGMSRKARSGEFNALLVFGEDPVVTDPDQNLVSEAMRALKLLVVVELSMTETAKLADVVLPAASFAEKHGTFTNCERRVQRVRQAIPPLGEAHSDWQILEAIAEAMGHGKLLTWASSEAVFEEMALLTPSYKGMHYGLIDAHDGLQWPCNAEHPTGTSVLHQGTFPIGKAQLIPVEPVAVDDSPNADYPLWLTTHRLHYHYGCGSMTRQSPILERETPQGMLFMHPQDAADLGLRNYQGIEVTSQRGKLETHVVYSQQVTPGMVSMPYHFKEAPSNRLTNGAMDPVTEMPELKACAVRVNPLPVNHLPAVSTTHTGARA